MTHHVDEPGHTHEPGVAHDDSHVHEPHVHDPDGWPVATPAVTPPVAPTVVTPPVVTTPPVHEHQDFTGYAAIKYTALVIIVLAVLYFLAVYVIPRLT